jgi:putative transposase
MVEQLVAQGYSVTDACAASGISRSTYYRQRQVHPSMVPLLPPTAERLRKQIHRICATHPFWGYRRVTAWLRYREDTWVNHKKVLRLMREEGLTVKRKLRPEQEQPLSSKPRAQQPNQYWGIDMTKFMIPTFGWTYLVIVLDWYTKKIVGWDLALRSRAQEWKQVLEQAVLAEFPEGVRGQGLNLISDNGTQPTAVSFMQTTATLDINQIFTTYNNPKGNAETERMMRTIKEEVVWIQEFTSLQQAQEVIKHWIEVDYHQQYVHSKLGYRSPAEFQRQFYQQQALRVAA